ncbi:hypothetical protein [Thalassovita aquimarina]|uniref:Uncharacterized protein n=1 Tax=Thalassovita aquimarina TaxID=2785917 RepID=A0ABS5HPN2_9RHOB|nr:hypothetical protein [Thalassovita aquimarina]MBR9650910.1 hypothetical protein [Thalassovita aquimarina]
MSIFISSQQSCAELGIFYQKLQADFCRIAEIRNGAAARDVTLTTSSAPDRQALRTGSGQIERG